MKLTIKRVDTSLPLPAYQTKGSVAFDLMARETTVVPPKAIQLIPLNIICKVPPGHVFLLMSRSSLPLKKGLMVANGAGIIDQDYCGEQDEVKVQVYNLTDHEALVERGERIAQALFVPATIFEDFLEVDRMSSESRGGFGSTGQT